jgi:hypothetical protein
MPLHRKEGPGIEIRGTLIGFIAAFFMIYGPYYTGLIYESQPTVKSKLTGCEQIGANDPAFASIWGGLDCSKRGAASTVARWHDV